MEEIFYYTIRGIEQFFLKSNLLSLLSVIVLILMYSLKKWNSVLKVLMMFGLGFLLYSLLLIFDIIAVSTKAIVLSQWGIIIMLFISCFYRLVFSIGRNAGNNNGNRTFYYVFTFVLGTLNSMLYTHIWGGIGGDVFSIFKSILSYIIGCFAGLFLISILYFFISYILQIVLRFTHRDWTLIVSSIMLGMLISEIITKI